MSAILDLKMAATQDLLISIYLGFFRAADFIPVSKYTYFGSRNPFMLVTIALAGSHTELQNGGHVNTVFFP